MGVGGSSRLGRGIQGKGVALMRCCTFRKWHVDPSDGNMGYRTGSAVKQEGCIRAGVGMTANNRLELIQFVLRPRTGRRMQ